MKVLVSSQILTINIVHRVLQTYNSAYMAVFSSYLIVWTALLLVSLSLYLVEGINHLTKYQPSLSSNLIMTNTEGYGDANTTFKNMTTLSLKKGKGEKRNRLRTLKP